MYFVECSVNMIDYDSIDIFNHPVNLSLCKSIQKSEYSLGLNHINKPSINFLFEGNDIEWVYIEEADRDSDYEFIMDNLIKLQRGR